jgi:hypothetical protein
MSFQRYPTTGNVDGPASATDGHLAVFDGTTGKLIKDGGAAPAGTIGGSTGATDKALLRANGTGGATLQSSTLTVSDTGTLAASSGTLTLTAPTLTTPALGTPASGVATNLTGTAAGLTAGSVTVPAALGSSTATTQAANDNSTKLATTAYVDSALSSFDSKPQVAYASTSALPSNTYANGASGVGATLTGTANGPLIIDSVTILIGQVGSRVLVGGEATAANNGWYTITQQGVVAVSPYILTRAVESDQAAEIGSGYLTSVIAPNGVIAGSANNGKVFISAAAADPFVVGTTNLTFSQVGSTYSAGNGLGLSGTTFSIDTSITADKTTVQTLTNKTLTSPVLTTPNIGVATATSVNKVAITAPATSATLVIADGKTATHNASTTFAGTDGKTLTVSNSLTLAGTDSTVMTFPGTSKTLMATDFSNANALPLANVPAGGSSGQVLSTNGSGTGSWVSTKTVLMGNGVVNTIALSSTAYMALPGFNASSATEGSRQSVIPLAGTIKNFYVVTGNAQPGDGALTITLRKNGVDTAVTITIAAGAASNVFTDLTHSFTVVAGDLLSIKFVNASASASAQIGGYAVEFDTP